MEGTRMKPDRSTNGLSIRPTAAGWALFDGGELVYECNVRARVEAVLAEELAKVRKLREATARWLTPLSARPKPAQPRAARPRAVPAAQAPPEEVRAHAIHEA